MTPIVMHVTLANLAVWFVLLTLCVATAYGIGLDEGRLRGRAEGRRLAQEAREKARQQLRESAWFPAGRHRS